MAMAKVKLTKDDVLHVAKLSNLKLTDEEIKKFTPQLSNIVDYISELSDVDTKNIDPVSQPLGLTNVLREDEVNSTNILSQEEALSGTDLTKNNLVEVPKILENRSDE